MSKIQKDFLEKISLGGTFKENSEQLLKSSGLTSFKETSYRVIKLVTSYGEKYRDMTIVAGVETYLICELLGRLAGNSSQYTIGMSWVNSVDVDMRVVQKFYAEEWHSEVNQIIDFLHGLTFIDVELILVDNGLEQKINKMWNRRHVSFFSKEDKETVCASIMCLDYGTYRIMGEAGGSDEISALHQWLQRAVILYKRYYAETVQISSIGRAHFGVFLSKDAHLNTMTCIDVGVHICEHTIVENYVLIHSGVQIGKNCRIGSGSIIGNGIIKPGELPTIVKDNSTIGRRVKIGTGIVLPRYVCIESGVCLKNSESVVFDSVTGHTIKCSDLVPGSVIVPKKACPCVISYNGLTKRLRK